MLSILTAAIQDCKAQVFVGSGFAGADFFGPSALDSGAGFNLQMEKDFNLTRSRRLKAHPNINVSFLFSGLRQSFLPSYFNVISLSPKVSYEIISGKTFKIAPFANPFASFLPGLRSNNLAFHAEKIMRYKWGVEGGLRIDFSIGNTVIRLVPLSVQRSIEDFYRHGMISLLVST